jgi:NADH:ubiquinone oxidoreductase subunit 4 (subunit M)
MNLIYLAFCFGDSFLILGGTFFCITHAFLSGLFFYLVDCVQRRFLTRSVAEVSGVLQKSPMLGVLILFGVIFYAGLPGTLKFISEVYLFVGLLDCCVLSFVLLIYGANFLGILGFSKC